MSNTRHAPVPSDTDDPASHPPRLDCRVVVLTHYLPPYVARVLYHASQQVREMRILLSIAQEPNRDFGNTWDGLTVNIQKSFMLRRPWRHEAGFEDQLYIHFPYDTYSQLRRANPDIVLSYELGFRSLTSAIYCRRHAKRLALCVCVSEHTERGRGALRRLLRRWLLKRADAITYNGPSCQRYLKTYGIPDEKLFHFPYATSDLFRYQGPLQRSPADDTRLLYVGQLSDRKGVVRMVRDLADYARAHPKRRLELDMIGTGDQAAVVQQLELPSNFHLRLLGHMDYGQIAQTMCRCGVLIFPTLADEWGLVVNEALQAGMPVLGSRYAQACATLVSEGENGWIYSPTEPAQLSRKLDLLWALSPAQWLEMRRAAQASVAHISSQYAAAQLTGVFEALCNRATAAAG